MRLHRPRIRLSFALLAAGALLAARAAPAQPLMPVVGAPIAYEVGVPADWELVAEDGTLEAGNEDVGMMVMTVDLLADDNGRRFTGDELRLRQERIQGLMTSDSLFLDVVTQQFAAEAMGVSGMTREIGTLDGERAAHLRGRMVKERKTTWFQVHVTIRGGIMYILVFSGFDDDAASREPLFVRIRESFRLPPPS
jgi:hypothetical protein